MPKRCVSGANASMRRCRRGDCPPASTRASCGCGAIICNIAKGAFAAAASTSRRSRSKRRSETRGRNHATLSGGRSEEHTSELQSLMRTSYAVFCLKKKKKTVEISYQRVYIEISTTATITTCQHTTHNDIPL